MSSKGKATTNAVVKFIPDGTGLHINWSFQTYFRKSEIGFDCHVPSFELYFNAKDEQEINKKSIAFSTLFFEYYISDHKKNGLKQLIIQLKKLGFKASNDLFAVRELTRNRFIEANFKSPMFEKPKEFDKINEVKGQLELA